MYYFTIKRLKMKSVKIRKRKNINLQIKIYNHFNSIYANAHKFDMEYLH
jgi:hypothetical protein